MNQKILKTGPVITGNGKFSRFSAFPDRECEPWWEADAEAGAQHFRMFLLRKKYWPHCRPIIANLTILFWMFHHYCDTLEWFLYILFCMFETLLVVWKQWNISKCSDQRIVKFVLYEWNIFKYFWQMFWNIVNVPTIIADVDLLVDIRWF